MRFIELDSGCILEAGKETSEGVWTDAGLIPWPWVSGFWTFCKSINKNVFVPIK
mgnify:CR=1 FL=1